MSHWDGEKIVRTPPVPYPKHPGWLRIDCGCCVGLEWGGETPRECSTCGGNGLIALHEASKRLALWPGGPFCGRA